MSETDPQISVKHTINRPLASLLATLTLTAALCAAETKPERIPLIDVTDLYHPHQDVGDNFDIIAAYALPEIDLRAVILDSTDVFRQPEVKDPGPGLWPDDKGPREPGFVPVLQLNELFGRNIPCATTPFARMESVNDKMLDSPKFQQQGIELILKTLRDSEKLVEITIFGSSRSVAAAFNRDPQLFRKKLAKLHLCAGTSPQTQSRFLEWNVALDPLAVVCLLRSGLPIALYPCAADNAGGQKAPPYVLGERNTYFKLPDLQFVPQMDPPVRRYLEYAFGRSSRIDFLRAVEEDGPAEDAGIFAKEHHVWETAVWLCVTGRKLVKRADDSYRIIPANEVLPTDKVLPNELRPCTVTVDDNGIYECRDTDQTTNFSLYYRGDAHENEQALQEALPELYLSFKADPAGN